MAFGFDISRRIGFPLPRFSRPSNPSPVSDVISYARGPTPDLNPDFTSTQAHGLGRLAPNRTVDNLTTATRMRPENPTLTQMPSYKPQTSWKDYWNTPLGQSGMSRADYLGEAGSILRDRSDAYIPLPESRLTLPRPPVLAGGGASQTRDVLQRVKARYGL